MAYESIIEALEDFDSKHIIGVGRHGTVYKAEFSTKVLAVKKIHAAADGEKQNFTSFENEIRALTELRHQNIVKLYGFCSHSQHSFLVYEFLSGGSLRNVLNHIEKAVEFDWKRGWAIKGIAKALSYMHHDCSKPIIHRDLSSNNVLIDSDWVAHISDFGTARLIKPDSSNWTSFAEPLVMLLQLWGTNTRNYNGKASMRFSHFVTRHGRPEILDQCLDPPDEQTAEQVRSVLKVAFSCLHQSPHSRPSMRDIALGFSAAAKRINHKNDSSFYGAA